jgi:hypothetical protein
MKQIFFLFLILASFYYIDASPRKVLIEILTNSHCPLCPPSHTVIDAYLQNGQYRDQVNFIYYHMQFPYPDDALYQHNTTDAAARNSFYGPFTSTPRGIFDGQLQSNNYASWAGIIDGIAVQDSPFELSLQGNVNGNVVNLSAIIKQTGSFSNNNLVVHFIVVENVTYSGRNGISLHKNVMRKMFPNASGKSFSISLNQTVQVDVSTSINSEIWNVNELGYLVFIQDAQTKMVHQSEFMTYDQILTTDVKTEVSLPNNFSISQNFPNPFNPSTTIKYALPEAAYVNIKIFNVIGKEIATLVNEEKQAGNYQTEFNASNIPSGVYFYRIVAGNYSETKRMILLK